MSSAAGAGGDTPREVPTGTAASSRDSDRALEFEKFFREYFPKLIRFLASGGIRTDIAEDAVTEAMITTYERWDTTENPAAFVRTVARMKAIDAHRREHRRTVLVPDLPEDLQITRDDPQHDLDQVLGVLTSLPQRQREVLMLTATGYTPAEIGERVTSSAPSVRSALSAARKTLRARLDHQSDDAEHTGACTCRQFKGGAVHNFGQAGCRYADNEILVAMNRIDRDRLIADLPPLLTEKQRLVCLTVDVEGLTLQDAAAQLGMSVSVLQQIRRGAWRRLQRHLTTPPPAPGPDHAAHPRQRLCDDRARQGSTPWSTEPAAEAAGQ